MAFNYYCGEMRGIEGEEDCGDRVGIGLRYLKLEKFYWKC